MTILLAKKTPFRYNHSHSAFRSSDSLVLYREMDHQNGITCQLGVLGRLAIHQGDYKQGSRMAGDA